MRGLRLTDENVQNQIAVVKEEIRVNVVNQPFGGFPWILLPPVMFKTFANAHNGYGSFVDLEAATVDQASEFFDQYYAPGNATLVVAGDLDVDKTREMIERHFGSVPARAVPPLGRSPSRCPPRSAGLSTTTRWRRWRGGRRLPGARPDQPVRGLRGLGRPHRPAGGRERLPSVPATGQTGSAGQPRRRDARDLRRPLRHAGPDDAAAARLPPRRRHRAPARGHRRGGGGRRSPAPPPRRRSTGWSPP